MTISHGSWRHALMNAIAMAPKRFQPRKEHVRCRSGIASDVTTLWPSLTPEAGDFDQAVKYEKQALNDSSIAPKEREEREKRLAFFEQRKPFREEF